MRSKIYREEIPFALLGAGIVGLFLALVALGIKEFSVWQQILDLELEDPVRLLTSLHPHALRFTVVLPYLVIARATGINVDWLFSIAIAIAMVWTSVMAGLVLTALRSDPHRFKYRSFLVAAIPVFGLSLAMNGRIAFAMAGIMFIAYQQTLWFHPIEGFRRWHPSWQVLGLWLSSVSSGTLAVAFLLVLLGNFASATARYPIIIRRNIPALFASVGGALVVLPMVGVGFATNIAFYGGGFTGFLNMLQHGAGKILPKDQILFVLTGLAFVLVGFGIGSQLLIIARSPSGRGPLYLTCLLGLVGGAFGFSTLACAAPAYLIAMVLWLEQPSAVTTAEIL